MIDFETACALINEISERTGIEHVPLEGGFERVLAEPVVAAIDSPRQDVSAMDGYAVRDSDLAELPARLEVAGEAFAGDAAPTSVEKGCCVRIFTGGPVPHGADRVVIQEVVKRDGHQAIFDAPNPSSRNIRGKGSDFLEGDLILSPGTWLDARSIVAAAAADIAEVKVFERPRVIVLATGDELAAPGHARNSSGAIPESVAFGVAAMVRRWGGECVACKRLPDEPDVLESAAREALGAADLVVVTGGASVGEKDYSRSMFSRLGLEIIFSKVAIKPGKPVWLGRSADRLVLGLPGNPTSALVTARLFLAPLLLKLGGGHADMAWNWVKAPIFGDLALGGGRETFLRACWKGGAVDPLSDQDSGAQRVLAKADLLVRRAIDAPALGAGELVEVLDF